MDGLIKLADLDGNGQIRFDEFARIVATEDILKLKDKLLEDPDNVFGSRNQSLEIVANERPQLRLGVVPNDVRHAQKSLQREVMDRYAHPREAFMEMGANTDGRITREAAVRVMTDHTKRERIPERVMQNLIDFVDVDQSGDISWEEFERVVECEDVMVVRKKKPHPFGLK